MTVNRPGVLRNTPSSSSDSLSFTEATSKAAIGVGPLFPNAAADAPRMATASHGTQRCDI